MSSKNMEKCFNDSKIRIKKKFTPYLKNIFNVDSLLSSVEFHQIEDVPPDEDNYVYFDVTLIEGIPQRTTSELQVNCICSNFFLKINSL